MTTTVAAVDAEVRGWLDRKGVPVNEEYGTVRLVKVVDSDLRSPTHQGRKLLYEPGTTVTAPDYKRTHACGQGLHFSATAAEARNIIGNKPRSLVCDVDLETLVVIDESKVKAEFCHVRFEGDETDFGRFA